jgi:hypothetical protein
MYLGTIYLSTKFRPNQTSNMATRWPSWKKTKCYYYQLQIFIIGMSNINKYKWHSSQVFVLTYFWRSQRSKLKMPPLVGTFRYYFDLEYSNIVLIGTVYIYTKFRPDLTSNTAARWSPWKLLHLSSYKQHYPVPELITISLSIITFSLSRTTVEVMSLQVSTWSLDNFIQLMST